MHTSRKSLGIGHSTRDTQDEKIFGKGSKIKERRV